MEPTKAEMEMGIYSLAVLSWWFDLLRHPNTLDRLYSIPHELQCARGIKRSNNRIVAQTFCPTVDWPLSWCRQEGVEGGSGPDQDQEQQAEEVEGGQGGEGRGRQGGAEEQGEHWQDGKVRSHLFRSLSWITVLHSTFFTALVRSSKSGKKKKRTKFSGEEFFTFSLDGLIPAYGDPSQVGKIFSTFLILFSHFFKSFQM